MSGPSISFRLPPLSLFTFPPPPEPPALPAPSASGTLAAPFTIPPALFNSVLDVRWPITIATLYAITAVSLNGVNRRRGFKPWAISKTRAFHAFVILHNVLLAVYSALTFVAMLRALRHSWPSHREYEFLGKMWPGLRTENGIAGAADALCKIHGPRGFGDAVYYNVTGGIWQSKNAAVQLAQDVVAPGVVSPDSRDVGRLWNEGLAFWGWWFYLSKFYEVVDTAIILAKGKRSSTLQTYHHAGAMFCMWAGIRYMGPPIWIFAFINSGIHALMYTYYTLSALRIPVKQVIKRTLTTLQITQFLVGFTFAALHLFVKYTVPVSTPIQVAVNAASSLSSAATAAPSSVSSAFSAAASAATSGIKWLPFLHAGILRAFGEEGLANNALRSGDVLPSMPEVPAHEASQKILNAPTKLKERFQTQYETVYQEVDCIDTAGQSFAVWLNLIYLAPLTVLFVRFFIRSYSRRYAAAKQLHEKQSIGSHRRRLSRSVEEAAGAVDRELNRLGESAEEGVVEAAERVARSASPSAVREQGRHVKKEAKQTGGKVVDATKEKGSQVAEKLHEGGQHAAEKVQDALPHVTQIAHEILTAAKGSLTDAVDSTTSTVQETLTHTPHDDDAPISRSSYLAPGDSAYGTFGASEIRESKQSPPAHIFVSDNPSYAEVASENPSTSNLSYAEVVSENPPESNAPEKTTAETKSATKSDAKPDAKSAPAAARRSHASNSPHAKRYMNRRQNSNASGISIGTGASFDASYDGNMRAVDDRASREKSRTRIPSPTKKPTLAKARPRTPSPRKSEETAVLERTPSVSTKSVSTSGSGGGSPESGRIGRRRSLKEWMKKEVRRASGGAGE